MGLGDRGDHSFSLQCNPVLTTPRTQLQTPQLKVAGKLAQCPAHPVLSPQALSTSSCMFTSLHSDSFRGKKKGRMRELKRERAREGEGEQRGRESRSRRGT